MAEILARSAQLPWSALTCFVVSTQSGKLLPRVGPRIMTAGGTALLGFGLLVLSITLAGSPLWLAQCGLILAGLGMGLNTGPLYGVAVGAVGTERSGTASALINVARMTGATLGVALLGTAFTMAHGAAAELHLAMVIGGSEQLCGALARLGVDPVKAAKGI